MIEKLREALAKETEKIERSRKLDAMLASLRTEEEQLARQLAALREELRREQADVERLERTSAASLFYSILGKKEARLEKQQQEAYAARLKHDAARRQLADCQANMDSLAREQAELGGAATRYQQLFQELCELLRSDPQYARQLCELERKRGEAEARLREAEEALAAGRACLAQAELVSQSLDSAEGWGTWDVLGGGLMADIVKHSHLDEAQDGAERLAELLGRFRTELADVNVSGSLGQVNVEGFLRFADYFFDGLIADWCVLSHIEESAAAIERLKAQISGAMESVNAVKRTLEAERGAINEQIARLARGR